MVIWGACVNHLTFNGQKTLYHGKNSISIKVALSKELNRKMETTVFHFSFPAGRDS